MKGIPNCYTYTTLAFSHAKGAAKLYLIANLVCGDQGLELLHYLSRALDMTGASDANRYFQHIVLPLKF